EIVVTSQDYDRLTTILEALPPGHLVGEQLAAELERADVVERDEIPPDVVTMNSRVVIETDETGEQHTVVLVYPSAADFEAGKLSILAPVGAALLGLRAGQAIDWPMPGGRRKQVRVVAVEWQPEAAGDPSL